MSDPSPKTPATSAVTSKDQFDRQAAHYNTQWNQWSEASLQWLLDHAECQSGDRLLDVATGTGFTAFAFAPLVGEVIGVDVSPGMLAQARKNTPADVANVRFESGAAEALPFPAASFDLVTCRVAPHHFADIAKFAAETFRVLKPGGQLLIADTSVPDGDRELADWQNRVEWLRDRSHVRNYAPGEWRQILESAGFAIDVIDRCDETNPMSLRDWMVKSGCSGDAARQVEQMFHSAPPQARQEFRIMEHHDGEHHDGDLQFQWMRVVVSARKPER